MGQNCVSIAFGNCEDLPHAPIATSHPNALQTNEEVVGHTPLRIASCVTVTGFLERIIDKGKVVVTGKRVNRRAGYGPEVPREYNNNLFALHLHS